MRKPKLRWRIVTWILLLAITGYMLHRFEHNQVYHPLRRLDAAATDLGRPVEELFLTARDGVKLHAWFFPSAPDSPRSSIAMLICHGNGGNISHRLVLYETLLARGVNVFAFDYRGYGLSEGKPGEEGTYLDAQAAHSWLREKGFNGANIIAYGESLGGAVAAELCLRESCGGLVLQSTFTSIPDVGAEFYPWLPVRWLSRIRYDTRSKLSRITVPVLVMHSRTDGLIKYAHGEANFAAVGGPKLFSELQGGHNDYLDDTREFSAGIERFLDLVASSNVPAPGQDAKPE